MTANSQFTTVMQQVARGERPADDLALIGVEVTPSRSGYRVRRTGFNPTGQTVSISLEDVGLGLLANHEDSDALWAWGTLLMAHDAFEVPEEADAHPDFDTIWGAVWDASFSGQVTTNAIRCARRLAQSIEEDTDAGKARGKAKPLEK